MAEPGMVHPRWVWGAVSSCIAGIVVVAVGIAALSWWIPILGVLLLALGVLMGFRAGWMYDVHASRPAPEELDEVREGGTHEGVIPGEMVRDPAAERHAESLEARRRDLLRPGRQGRPPLAGLGGGLLLLTALVLLVAQWTLYPYTATGQANGVHSSLVAVVAALVGLRVLTGRGEPHPLAMGIGTVAGLALLVLAWWAPHSSTDVARFETVCAAAVIAGALAVGSWRER